MGKWKSKACPRCGGDMFLDRDLDFWYEQCLQCSYKVELKPLKVRTPVLAGQKGLKKHEDDEEAD
jgi:hypothetical protein